jgi:hypothetical protein
MNGVRPLAQPRLSPARLELRRLLIGARHIWF